MTFDGLGATYLVGYFCGFSIVLVGIVGTLLIRGRLRRRQSQFVWIANASLSLLMVAALIFVFEGYFAFAYDETDSWGLLNTSQLWFRRHVPHTNNLGARERGTVTPQGLPNTMRIFFIGDSFTWGHGIARQQDRFSDLVAADLARRFNVFSLPTAPSRQIECHNVSYLGVDTGDELETVRELLDDGYRLDLLILVYCMNDIADLVPQCVELTQSIYASQPDFFLVRDTYFLNFLYHRWTIMRSAAYADYYGDVRGAYDGPAWSTQCDRLGEIVSRCRDANVELRVVTFPLLHDLGEHYPLRSAHQKLSEFWNDHSVPHIDLLDVYAAYRSADLVVNRFDAHPNELAHRLAADAILQRWFAGPVPQPDQTMTQ